MMNDSVNVSLSRIKQLGPDSPMLYNDAVKVAGELERLQKAIGQLAADYPDAPVSYPHDVFSFYQEIRDWVNRVLGDE